MEEYILNIGIVIQARMGSSRLPGKVLKKIGNKNLLEHILYRLTKLTHVTKTVIATSTLKRDDIIVSFCKKNQINFFRGSEEDVLERYYLCAKLNNFNHIVRLTGDNPFIDIPSLNNLIKQHMKTNADYSRSFNSLPKGVGAEIFTFNALEKSYLNGKKRNHKEHVNEYIEENEDKFRVFDLSIKSKKSYKNISLTLDTEDDYKKACFIVKNAKKEYIPTEEAIELCLQYA